MPTLQGFYAFPHVPSVRSQTSKLFHLLLLNPYYTVGRSTICVQCLTRRPSDNPLVVVMLSFRYPDICPHGAFLKFDLLKLYFKYHTVHKFKNAWEEMGTYVDL